MKKSKLIKKGLLVLGLGVTLIGLAACGSSKEKADGKDGKIEIRLLTRMAGTAPQVGIWQDVIDEFAKEHPEVKIVDESTGDEGSFNNLLKTSRASNDLPNIYRIQGVANLGEYIDNDLIMNMTPVLEADKEWSEGFNEGALNYYEVPNYEGIYGLPMESGLIGVYYNKELFEKAGISKFPETWSEFKVAIEALNKSGVVPISLGAKSTYTVGHLHNLIFYRSLGTDAAKKMGTGEMKWTDKEVVATLESVKELADLGAFDPSAVGIDDNVALNTFLKGDAAMIITGPWNISKFNDKAETKFSEAIEVAKFPYFDDKEQFKNEDMQVISPIMVNGKLEGKEKELTIELAKRLTDKDIATRLANEANWIFPRTDFELKGTDAAPLFVKNVELAKTSTGIAVDVFDYDPNQAMQDVTRNTLVGIIQGTSPTDAAKTIQEASDSKK